MLKVDAIAEEHGHEVMMLPPYRPELNGIENAWGVTKNFVADNNDPRVTFANLLGVIEQGLKQVSMASWIKIDQKVQREEAKQLKHLRQEKQQHDDFVAAHPDLQFTLSDSDSSSSFSTSSTGDEGPTTDERTDDIANVLDVLSDGLGGDDQPLVDYAGSSELIDIWDEPEQPLHVCNTDAACTYDQPHDNTETINISEINSEQIQEVPSYTEDDLLAVHSLLHLANLEE